jgi:hypothetical protein
MYLSIFFFLIAFLILNEKGIYNARNNMVIAITNNEKFKVSICPHMMFCLSLANEL